MSLAPNKELNRQFRVLGQMISMHAILRDRYSRLALCLDLLLLASSVIFCATTFAKEYISNRLCMSVQLLGDVLGIASIATFFGVLALLILDWKGKSAKHASAFRVLSNALAQFRKAKGESGWQQDQRDELNQAYWDAMNGVPPIPDRQFPHLKARHLRKIAVSKLLDSLPGCPIMFIRVIIFCRSLKKAIWRRHIDGERADYGNHEYSENSIAISDGEGDGD